MAAVIRLIKKAFEDKKSRTYHIVNDILALIIIAAVIIIAIESVEEIYSKYRTFFLWSEVIVMTIFTIEYFIYIYLAPKKLKYILSPMGLIDLLAILPTFLGLIFIPVPALHALRVLRVVRVLRLLRILRLLKLLSYANKHKPNAKKYLDEIPWRNIEIYFFTMFSIMVIAGTLIFLAESGVTNTTFISIPHSLWWAIVTLTTVGYGDMVPSTLFGRIIASITMISGVMLFAILVSVIGGVIHKILFGIEPEEEDKLKNKR